MKNDFANITVYRHSLIISLDLLFILILVSSLLCGLASNFFYRLYKTTTHKTFLSQNKTRLIHLEICLVKTVNKHHFVIMCICYTKNFAAWKVSICGVFPYFPVFRMNTGKNEPEKLRIWSFFAQCVRERLHLEITSLNNFLFIKLLYDYHNVSYYHYKVANITKNPKLQWYIVLKSFCQLTLVEFFRIEVSYNTILL